MKSRLSPKKSARIAKMAKSKRLVSYSRSEVVALANRGNKESKIEFNFEEITPDMQIKERNSAYNFFSL